MFQRRFFRGTMIVIGFLCGVPSSQAELPPAYCATGATTEGQQCTRGTCDAPGKRNQWVPAPNAPNLTIRLKFNNFSGLDGDVIAAQVAHLNDVFEDYHIRFIHSYEQILSHPTCPSYYSFCEGVQYIEDCFCRQGECRGEVGCGEIERAMKECYADDPGQQLNIYIVNMDHVIENVGEPAYRGLGYGPWCSQALDDWGGVIVDYRFVGGVGVCNNHPCSLLAHEIGHNLGLWHTHRGVTEITDCDSLCREKVGAPVSELDVSGDLCSDTPPTPSANFQGCFEPQGTDSCTGLPFGDTDEHNFLGYGGDGCWDHFTVQQTARMHCWSCDPGEGLIPWMPGAGAGACYRPSLACELTGKTCCDTLLGVFCGAGTA